MNDIDKLPEVIKRSFLVGYTNAGKSSLLNSLTGGIYYSCEKDKLFATLDPTTQRLELPSGQILLVTNTVRFVRFFFLTVLWMPLRQHWKKL